LITTVCEKVLTAIPKTKTETAARAFRALPKKYGIVFPSQSRQQYHFSNSAAYLKNTCLAAQCIFIIVITEDEWG